jgi:phospholipid/cholesterol/gamma-HCH transport system substrate-binding protein
LLNELAFNPPGKEEGFLFWLAWANHNANSLFSMRDAHGAIRHSLLFASCEGVSILENLVTVNPQVKALLELVNIPNTSQICPPGTTTTPTLNNE